MDTWRRRRACVLGFTWAKLANLDIRFFARSMIPSSQGDILGRGFGRPLLTAGAEGLPLARLSICGITALQLEAILPPKYDKQFEQLAHSISCSPVATVVPRYQPVTAERKVWLSH